LGDLRREEAEERELGRMRANPPWRRELGPRGVDGEDARGRNLIKEEQEELEHGGIGPLEVLDDDEQRVVGGDLQHDDLEGVQQALALLLRGQREWRIAVVDRQGEQGGEQRYHFEHGKAVLSEPSLERAKLLVGGRVTVGGEYDAFEQFGHGMESTLLVIGRALKRGKPGARVEG